MSWKRYSVHFIRYRNPTSSVPEQPAVLVIYWWYWITSDCGGPTNQLIFFEWWPFCDGENVTLSKVNGDRPNNDRGQKWSRLESSPGGPNIGKIHLVDVENPINKWDIRYRSLNWCWKDILQNPWPPPSDTARWWACWRDEGPNLRIRWSGLVRVYPYYKPSLRFRISKAWDSLGFWWKNCLPNPCWISVVNLISWMNLGV